MILKVFNSLLLASAVLASFPGLRAQSLVSNVTMKGDSPDQTQIAIPGGAGAFATGTGTAGAGPLIGFQIWKPDDFLLSSFFTFSAPQSVSGAQRDFGSFLLNPPGQGTSFSFAGNKLLRFCSGLVVKGCQSSEAIFLFGIAGRAGITNTTWQNSATPPQSTSGTVAYATPSLIFTSRTIRDSTDPKANEYQFGVSAGPSWRVLAGDLGQNSDISRAFRIQALGVDRRAFTGAEVEFFVRMNSFQPFVRYSYFPVRQPNTVDGFSGSQVVFGVNVLSSIFQKTI